MADRWLHSTPERYSRWKIKDLLCNRLANRGRCITREVWMSAGSWWFECHTLILPPESEGWLFSFPGCEGADWYSWHYLNRNQISVLISLSIYLFPPSLYLSPCPPPFPFLSIHPSHLSQCSYFIWPAKTIMVLMFILKLGAKVVCQEVNCWNIHMYWKHHWSAHTVFAGVSVFWPVFRIWAQLKPPYHCQPLLLVPITHSYSYCCNQTTGGWMDSSLCFF